MIYPTRFAVLLAAAGAPLAFLLSAFAPELWLAGPAWVILIAALMLADSFAGGSRQRLETRVEAPDQLAVGIPATVAVSASFPRGARPSAVEAALQADARLGLETRARAGSLVNKSARLSFQASPQRRGEALISKLWVRWRGPLGLVWKQRVDPLQIAAHVGADIHGVKTEAMRLFARDALFGIKAQTDVGEGSEFHALRDFQAGMDRRTVDWKQSARHMALLAKEFRTERNHQVIMALDSGRVMSEPVAGAPRIDHAINASLLLAYVCLRTGDRAGLYAFDEKPRANSGAVAGMNAFPLLQRIAQRIDYSPEEANYTLGLTALSGSLQRRSMIVIFTDFADSTSAELMLETLGRLLKRHLVVFVVMRDAELEGLTGATPDTSEDVSRAVIAGRLLNERDAVITRLRRMGAHIVEAPVENVGPALLNAYLEIKRRDLL
jgi:uncharacterized protein (DUF58 family)